MAHIKPVNKLDLTAHASKGDGNEYTEQDKTDRRTVIALHDCDNRWTDPVSGKLSSWSIIRNYLAMTKEATTKELFDAIKAYRPSFTREKFYWRLYKSKREHLIESTGYRVYKLTAKGADETARAKVLPPEVEAT